MSGIWPEHVSTYVSKTLCTQYAATKNMSMQRSERKLKSMLELLWSFLSEEICQSVWQHKYVRGHVSVLSVPRCKMVGPNDMRVNSLHRMMSNDMSDASSSRCHPWSCCQQLPIDQWPWLTIINSIRESNSWPMIVDTCIFLVIWIIGRY